MQAINCSYIADLKLVGELDNQTLSSYNKLIKEINDMDDSIIFPKIEPPFIPIIEPVVNKFMTLEGEPTFLEGSKINLEKLKYFNELSNQLSTIQRVSFF